jgi:RNA polymerase sigma-70 factor (ECF subfamily)
MYLSVAIAIQSRQAKKGPLPDDFSAIYEEHSRPIYYFILRYLSDATQAEDATHDVFIKAYKNLSRFRGDSSIRTWLYRIAVNHCKNLRQSWHARKVQYESEIEDHLLGDTVDTPFKILETTELGERIQATLDELPRDYAMLLLMVADQKMSYEKVAQLTAQSPDAVRGKLYRARKAFTKAFKRSK